MLLIVTYMEDATMHPWVQGLDAAIEHFGEAGQVADVADGQAGVAEGMGGTAGGDELDTVGGEGSCKIHEASLVGYGEESTADRA